MIHLKRWFGYAKPYLPYFIIGPVCMIVEVLGEVLMPKFLAGIIDNGVVHRDIGHIILMTVLMILSALLMMAGGVGGSYFGTKASVNFAADLRNDVYAKVQEFSFANIDRFSTGSLVTRLTNDVTQIQNFINMLLRMALRAPGMMIGGLIMAISMRPDLAVILLITVPLLLLCLATIIRTGFPRFGIMQKKIDALNSNVRESVTNARVIKSFVREDFEEKRFAESNKNLKEAGMSAMRVMMLIGPTMTFFMYLTTLLVIWFGGNNVIAGNMLIGDLTAFITYINQILSSLMMVSMLFVTSSRAMASAKRISEVLDESIDLNDDFAAHPEKTVENGSIEFKNVNFRYYKQSEGKVLDNINIKINAGETVGIIGSTGCGKSTLVSMIPRLYDVDEGEVLVDGINVKDYSLYNLREGVGMVLQKNVLFAGSVKENLLWGDENATDEMIEAAAESAQADGFVKAFKKGYDYDLGQGGTNVSGGQKQRLCIARALLKRPKILILDDSTSAVDTATEARIREAFRSDLKKSTKIIIAQRISSVIDADKIIVLNEGAVTGIGTHEELLKSNNEYQEIYYSQMDKEEVTA